MRAIYEDKVKVLDLTYDRCETMLPPVSMEPWTAIKKTLPQCDSETNSCPGPYPMAMPTVTSVVG